MVAIQRVVRIKSSHTKATFFMHYELSHTLISQIIRCLPCRTSKVMLLEGLMMKAAWTATVRSGTVRTDAVPDASSIIRAKKVIS